MSYMIPVDRVSANYFTVLTEMEVNRGHTVTLLADFHPAKFAKNLY